MNSLSLQLTAATSMLSLQLSHTLPYNLNPDNLHSPSIHISLLVEGTNAKI